MKNTIGNLKKCMGLMLAIMMLVTLCGSVALAETAKPMKVFVVAPNAGDSWGRLGEGFLKACEEKGWDGQFTAPVSATNIAGIENVELCEAAINAGADVIMVFAQDSELFADVLQRAREMGIYVVALAKPTDDADLRVGADDANLGHSIAEALVTAMEGKEINVVEMMTDVTSFGQLGQISPFEEKLAEIAPEATIVAREDCSSSADAADKLSATYLAHPELNCMITVASEAVTGSVAFTSDYGIADEFTIIGFDDTAEVLHAVKDGALACTVSAQWYDIGYQAVQIVYDILVNGVEYEYSQSIPARIIYPEDVDAYAEQYGIDMT
ncbi:MAG: substrate-binding domain-containing protein [Clostridiales bacterium]|nr:substrate-binding domain-containing protein [Clostridiales bacterium]